MTKTKRQSAFVQVCSAVFMDLPVGVPGFLFPPGLFLPEPFFGLDHRLPV